MGIGELKTVSDKKLSKNSQDLLLSHVVPDLILKILNSDKPVEILGKGNQVRHYTYGGDLAKGIVLLLTHPNAKNDDFNISTDVSTTVLELAEIIWNKLRPEKEFKYTTLESFEYDVQKRIPSVDKAFFNLLNYKADTTLSQMLDKVIPWMIKAKEQKLY